MKQKKAQAKCHNCLQYSSLISIQEHHISPEMEKKMQEGWQIKECSVCGCPHFYAVNTQLRYFTSEIKFDEYMRRNAEGFRFTPHTIERNFRTIDKIQYTSILW